MISGSIGKEGERIDSASTVRAYPVRVGRTIVWMHGIAGAHPCALWARIAFHL